MSLSVLFVDLDGTLYGPGGSLFSTERGDSTLRAAEALKRLHDADVKLVLVSGRTRIGMQESARITGARAYIAELGALLVERDGSERVFRNYGAYSGDGSPFDAMARSGAGAYLLDRFRGCLEPHTPWSAEPREATMLFRGYVPNGSQALKEAGYDWLELRDNGLIPRRFPGLDVEEVHAYHLVPRGVGKAAGVRLYLRQAGIPPEHACAVGDALSDLEIATNVHRVFLVANGRPSIPEEALARFPNASFTEASHGEGFAEAVEQLLEAPRTEASPSPGRQG